MPAYAQKFISPRYGNDKRAQMITLSLLVSSGLDYAGIDNHTNLHVSLNAKVNSSLRLHFHSGWSLAWAVFAPEANIMELIQQEQRDEEILRWILETFTINCHIFLLETFDCKKKMYFHGKRYYHPLHLKVLGYWWGTLIHLVSL